MPVDFSTFHNVIDGKLRGAERSYHSINPATEEELWPVPIATKADLEDAVTAGTRAYQKWSQTPVETRKEALRSYAKALRAAEEEMSSILTKETGKPQFLAKVETVKGPGTLTTHCNYEIPEVVTHEDDDLKVTVYYEPLGIVGAICPWNFPLILAIMKIAPALLMGNVVIVKPSPFTPYSTLKAVEIAQEHFPPGVLQVLGGDEQLGPWIVDHPKIPKIAFTGSVATGKKVQERAAKHLKRTTLELGGNDPAIVFGDVDIPSVAQQLAVNALLNTGQYCLATKRIYIHDSIYTSFVSALRTAILNLPMGDPTNPTTMIGPLQNRMQYDKVRALLESCKASGLEFALDGSSTPSTNGSEPSVAPSTTGTAAVNGTTSGTTNGTHPTSTPRKGLFIPPHILSAPPPTSSIMTDEQFGPLTPCAPFSDVEAVIAAANDTRYGLGASVWSADVQLAQRVARRLETGTVWVNTTEGKDSSFLSGAKESGIGGEGGRLGLVEYAQAKTVYLPKRGREGGGK